MHYFGSPGVLKSLLSLGFFCASFAHAAGYAVNEQSASSMGTAYAGRASNAEDASVSSSNPSAIAFLDRQQITLGTAVILEGGEFEGQHRIGDANIASGSSKNFQKTTWVPFGYYTLPVNEKWYVGLSAYAPFGIHLDYDKNFAGRYFGDKTEFSVINLQGTIAWKFHEQASIGIGLIGSRVEGEMTQQAILPVAPPSPGISEGRARMKGDDTVFGWNIGLLWQVCEQTMLGISYHSELKFKLDGTSELSSNIPAYNYKHKAELEVTMPERVMVSITHDITEQWAVMADATWTGWSSFKEFHVRDKVNSVYDSYVPENWKDVWAFSLGTAYRLDEEWMLKAGYMYDDSPITDSNRTVRTPGSDRHWFTLGLKWDVSPDTTLDFSWAYVALEKGKIHEQKHNPSGTNPPVVASYGELTGKYENSSHIVAAQLTYRF